MSDATPIVITSALPYANGPVHLGHIVENVQSDIYARFNRLIGRDVMYVCAADTHGTPIEVNARKQGIDPAEMVERFRQEHERDFRDFHVSFDLYYTTNSEENRFYSEKVYSGLKAGGHVFTKMVEQFYCETDKRFLPDRFVKGTCPVCGTPDQYGDVCESCHKTYRPTELKAPFCTICRNPPVRRESKQIFVRLSDFTEFLRDFAGRLQPEVRNYVSTWIESGLADWDISRDGPYFGFAIPGETNKYFYVWLDAPVGYIASAAHLSKQKGLDLDRYWPGTTDKPASHHSEIVHFIGKDIIYFHTLFWPAMLKAAGFAVPSKVNVHGMLSFGGEKMSKSRGRMITARAWLNGVDPAYLRYYLAANLGPGLDDIEFSLEELRNRVNAGAVKNIGNLAQRVLKFAHDRFERKLSRPTPLPEEVASKLASYIAQAKAAFAAFNYREAVKNIEALATWANGYMQSNEPWKTIKTDSARAQADVSLLANIVKALATMLAPIVPKLSEELLSQLGVATNPLRWDDGVAFSLGENHLIGIPKPLLPELEEKTLASLFGSPEAAAPAKPAGEPLEAQIPYDHFAKVDLRVGIVVAAERIPEANKLLKLSVDLGEGTPRTIAAGIAESYKPEEMVGKKVLVVANLEPKTIRGVESRGMLLAASVGKRGLALADIPGDATPGTRVR